MSELRDIAYWRAHETYVTSETGGWKGQARVWYEYLEQRSFGSEVRSYTRMRVQDSSGKWHNPFASQVIPVIEEVTPAPAAQNTTDITGILQAMNTMQPGELILLQSKADRLNPSPAAKKREKRMAGDSERRIEVYSVPRTLADGTRKKYYYRRYVWYTRTPGGKRQKHVEYIGPAEKGA